MERLSSHACNKEKNTHHKRQISGHKRFPAMLDMKYRASGESESGKASCSINSLSLFTTASPEGPTGEFDRLTAGEFDRLTAGEFDRLTAGEFDRLTTGEDWGGELGFRIASPSPDFGELSRVADLRLFPPKAPPSSAYPYTSVEVV